MTPNTKYTVINITNVESLIKDKSFNEINSTMKEYGVDVRILKNIEENNVLNDLYLLAADKTATSLSNLQLECNGLIFEKNTNKIVCMAQNKFNNAPDNMSETILDSKYRMEYCEDGTVIRLYNYSNQWITSTTRCIDARKSYWSSEKTFDDMFWTIFDNSGYTINDLDISYTYSFIVIHKENRIVVNHKYNNLIYINRINNNTKEEDFTNYFYNDNPKRCIRRTKQIESNTIIHSPLDDYYHPDKRGVIIKVYDINTNSWKLYQHDFNNYITVKDIRGNVPLIRMRYLELLNEPEKLELLERYYPEHTMVFAMIKHCMNNLYKEIHNLYFQSHIKHNITVEESHKFYRTLRQLHGTFKKQGTIITLEEVIKKVNSFNPHIIKTLVGWVN
jgi:hypothetical protein